MSPTEVRKKVLATISKIDALELEIAHHRLAIKHVQLSCLHPDKQSDNTWGRDPGGAYCPDCGKHW